MSNSDENLKRLITVIKKAKPSDCIMSSAHCGTAHCIGGWIELIEPGINVTDYLSLSMEEGHELTLLPINVSLHQFDRLKPSLRKKLMLDVLNNLLVTGEVNWQSTFEKHGVEL